MTLHGFAAGDAGDADGQQDYSWLQEQLAAAGLNPSAANEGGEEAGPWEDPSDGLLSRIFELCEQGCGDPPEELQATLRRLAEVSSSHAAAAAAATITDAAAAATDTTDEAVATALPAHPPAFSIDTAGPDGDSALHIAALFGHLPCVKALLAAGAAPGVVNQADGSTALHDASAGGYLDIAELMLQGAPETVHAADEDGDTPLHHAARGGHAHVVERLLAAGADPTRRNNSQQTPKDEADGCAEVIAVLRAAVAAKIAAATAAAAGTAMQ